MFGFESAQITETDLYFEAFCCSDSCLGICDIFCLGCSFAKLSNIFLRAEISCGVVKTISESHFLFLFIL